MSKNKTIPEDKIDRLQSQIYKHFIAKDNPRPDRLSVPKAAITGSKTQDGWYNATLRYAITWCNNVTRKHDVRITFQVDNDHNFLSGTCSYIDVRR